MSGTLTPDLCIVGGGSGGLVVAAGAVQLGLDVVLVERSEMGGDCLNHGCIPSKALIAAGKAAQAHRSGAAFGVMPVEPQVDFAKVMDHVAGVIAAIGPNDSVARFEKLGVRVIKEEARFTGPHEMQAGPYRIRARRIVLATGSRPATPPIPGLADVPYLDNESIFTNRVCPPHLLIIGGGAIGLEMAQSHRRLGAQVTVIEGHKCLVHDDQELVAMVARRLRSEGVVLHEAAKIVRVERAGAGVAVVLEGGERLEGSHLLVAAGRKPNVEHLDLDKAGIAFTPHGITVDEGLRTSNRGVWAIGDCNGRYAFTHMAGYEASLFIRGALFRAPARMNHGLVPWAIFTDPELAQVGLTEAKARETHGDAIKVLRWTFAENDRAQTERETDGMIKVITDTRGHVLGATMVGPHAGDLIQLWCLVISARLKISTVASFVPPYPTLGEVSKRAAGSYYTETLFGPRTRALVKFLLRLPVW